jgi:hypothetical protein
MEQAQPDAEIWTTLQSLLQEDLQKFYKKDTDADTGNFTEED